MIKRLHHDSLFGTDYEIEAVFSIDMEKKMLHDSLDELKFKLIVSYSSVLCMKYCLQSELAKKNTQKVKFNVEGMQMYDILS